MRTKLLLLLIFFLLAACGSPQRSIQVIAYTADVESPQSGYASANKFAKMVGDALKEHYPSRVRECEVNLILATNTASTSYAWRCEIEPSSAKDADYYFDHRGNLASAKIPEEARSAATWAVKQSDSVAKASLAFKQSFGALPRTLNKSIVVGPDTNGFYWSINETFFMVAGSPPE